MPRLLKKVQSTHPSDGYPAARDVRCETYLVRTSQRRASTPTLQMGLFHQPARGTGPPGTRYPGRANNHNHTTLRRRL